LRQQFSPTFWDCWIEAAAVRAAVEGPQTLQPFLASSASGYRSLGLRSLLRAAAKRPALLPEIQTMLRRMTRSVWPQARCSAAQADEALTLLGRLQRASSREGDQEDFNLFLDWLPHRGMSQELSRVRDGQGSHCRLPAQ
jgi:hypothetical protein